MCVCVCVCVRDIYFLQFRSYFFCIRKRQKVTQGRF